jgi:hypothetical protein
MTESDKWRYMKLCELTKKKVNDCFELKNLVDDLEKTVLNIEEKDIEWQKLFMEKWWILEEYNSIFYNNENKSQFLESVNKINRTLDSMFEIINMKI